MTENLTNKEYWNSGYQERSSVTPVDVSGARNFCAQQMLRLKERFGLGGRSVLEIGGGGSAWLVYLAREYPDVDFATVDYSDEGAQLIRDYVREQEISNVSVFQQDFFAPADDIGRYDFVYSHGVVEHFPDLAGTLKAHARFLQPGGRMLTIIPNMNGAIGLLTKWMNRDVYDIHVPHDLTSFLEGHRSADLEIVDSGYLCSTNFGVLSSCVRDGDGFKWFLYKQLSRVSKALWYFECHVTKLPATRWLSPYIYAVSTRKPSSDDAEEIATPVGSNRDLLS